MTDSILLFALLALVAAVTAMAFYWGWTTHEAKNTPITTQAIEKYVETKFPEKWAAYKQGVSEGYEQGLRDGQELPNEPS